MFFRPASGVPEEEPEDEGGAGNYEVGSEVPLDYAVERKACDSGRDYGDDEEKCQPCAAVHLPDPHGLDGSPDHVEEVAAEIYDRREERRDVERNVKGESLIRPAEKLPRNDEMGRA